MTDLSRVVCFCNPDPKFLLTISFGFTEDCRGLTSTLASGFLTSTALDSASSGIVNGGGLGFSRVLGFEKKALADFLCLVACCNFPTI